MGVTYRYGNYLRRVWLGKRTVKDGEGAIVWHRDGRSEELVGPRLKYLFFSTIQFMDRYTVTSDQYLAIKFRDGRRENIRGPCTRFKNHILHEEIVIHDIVNLLSEQHVCIVLNGSTRSQHHVPLSSMTSTKECGKVQSDPACIDVESSQESTFTVIRGPATYLPAPNDKIILQTWAFDGESGSQQEQVLFVGSRTFKHAASVRLVDGVRCTLELSVQFRIDLPQKMVRTTNNPRHELCLSLSRDVGRLVSNVSSDVLLDAKQQLDFFAQLEESFNVGEGLKASKDTCERHGLTLELVQVTDLDGLDNKFKEYQKHQADLDAVRAEEKLGDLRIQHEKRRVNAQQELEEQQMRNKIALQEMEEARELRYEKLRNEQQLEFLKSLHDLGVNLEKVLQPVKVPKHLRLTDFES